MMKKTIAALLCALMLAGLMIPGALAVTVGERRAVIAADLSEEQREQIYKDFGVEPGSVKELTVTNDEERSYLKGLVPDGKIGNVALSCFYIETLKEGSGLSVTTDNINWCTEQMYVNALITAGITDAKVIISAPFDVSGTAALTGAFKAYEDITGEPISEAAKLASTMELVTTGNLAEVVGSVDATKLVTELKKILDQTSGMSDDEVRQQIREIAKKINVSVTDEQVEQLLGLCRSMEKLDVNALKEKLETLVDAVKNMSKADQLFTSIGDGIKSFFTAVGDFLSKLFG
ncbi:MAG: DUF1002 domain-containing protein [Bacillota bacterium]